MTPEQAALLADARHLLVVLGPLCQHLPQGKRAGHLAEACTALVKRIDTQVPREVR